MNKEKKLSVSDEFLDIYLNINVNSQFEKMKKLSKKELYLLLILIIDKFSDEDPTVIKNISPFMDEIMKIYDVQDDIEVTDEDLLTLIKETDDKYIDTDILCHNDEKLPNPLDKIGVRDAKIDLIIK